ncbi:hypothetical protein Skr01_68460 [Sphaerisporangium krabiense]|nr:hypothetical protein Skr01_68460 [Sphaerisporangium krabiense]
MSRDVGRHRIGTPPEPVTPRRWDLSKRAAAAELDRSEPAWFVFYGVGSRQFVAIGTWWSAEPVRVEARTAEELRELMHEAENGSAASSGWPREWVA